MRARRPWHSLAVRVLLPAAAVCALVMAAGVGGAAPRQDQPPPRVAALIKGFSYQPATLIVDA
ncbi:MAG: hypothetical protein ACYDCQ_11260, partial [Dehalococcoidia bacterium]